MWRPIASAPKEGKVEDILLKCVHNGRAVVYAGHWAHGDGDGLIPPFGPAWFRWTGYGFVAIEPEPTHWMPMPGSPPVHYGSNGHAECGASGKFGEIGLTKEPDRVTCVACRGWLPIIQGKR